MTFAAMLKQECGWFDEEEHSVGILASHLSGDAASVQTVSITKIESFFNTFWQYIIIIWIKQ